MERDANTPGAFHALRAQLLASSQPLLERALGESNAMSAEAVVALPMTRASASETRMLFAQALVGAISRDWEARFDAVALDNKPYPQSELTDLQALAEVELFEEREHNLLNEQMTEVASISQAAARVAQGRPDAIFGLVDAVEAMAEAAYRSHGHFMDMEDDRLNFLESSRLLLPCRRAVCAPLIILTALEHASPQSVPEEALARIGARLAPWIDMEGPQVLTEDARELFGAGSGLLSMWFGEPDAQHPSPAVLLNTVRRLVEAAEIASSAPGPGSRSARPRV